MKNRIEKLDRWYVTIAINEKMYTKKKNFGCPIHLTERQHEWRLECEKRCIDRQKQIFNKLAKSIEL